MVDTILFDLDGTLLPMQVDIFTKVYFQELARKCANYGYHPDRLISTIWAGTKAMVLNEGKKTNEQQFWEVFAREYGEARLSDQKIFDDFYRNEFNDVKQVASPTELAGRCVKALQEKGYRLILASNPVFPKIAMQARMRWAGVNPDDFALITSYENMHYCKPNMQYYEEILSMIGKQPAECMMVGNHVREDMCAGEIGCDTYLITDYMEADAGVDISQYKNSSFSSFYQWVHALPVVR